MKVYLLFYSDLPESEVIANAEKGKFVFLRYADVGCTFNEAWNMALAIEGVYENFAVFSEPVQYVSNHVFWVFTEKVPQYNHTQTILILEDYVSEND